MPGYRIWMIVLWCMLSLLVIAGIAGLRYSIVDGSGPLLWTTGTVIATEHQDGMRMHTDVPIDDKGMSVPVDTQFPESWEVEVDSTDLGKVQVSTSTSGFQPHQIVYLAYKIGKLSGERQVQGLYARRPDPIVHGDGR
jgi:hypothetical protein